MKPFTRPVNKFPWLSKILFGLMLTCGFLATEVVWFRGFILSILGLRHGLLIESVSCSRAGIAGGFLCLVRLLLKWQQFWWCQSRQLVLDHLVWMRFSKCSSFNSWTPHFLHHTISACWRRDWRPSTLGCHQSGRCVCLRHWLLSIGLLPSGAEAWLPLRPKSSRLVAH